MGARQIIKDGRRECNRRNPMRVTNWWCATAKGWVPAVRLRRRKDDERDERRDLSTTTFRYGGNRKYDRDDRRIAKAAYKHGGKRHYDPSERRVRHHLYHLSSDSRIRALERRKS